MRQELLFNIKRYYELRQGASDYELGSYDELEQRLCEADHLIQLLARDIMLTVRPDMVHHVV